MFLELVMSVGFFFHLSLLYCGYFRLLKFMVSLEVVSVIIFFFFCLVMVKGEFSGLLFYMAVLACEASVGLGLLVGLLRFFSVGNVKVDVYSSF